MGNSIEHRILHDKKFWDKYLSNIVSNLNYVYPAYILNFKYSGKFKNGYPVFEVVEGSDYYSRKYYIWRDNSTCYIGYSDHVLPNSIFEYIFQCYKTSFDIDATSRYSGIPTRSKFGVLNNYYEPFGQVGAVGRPLLYNEYNEKLELFIDKRLKYWTLKSNFRHEFILIFVLCLRRTKICIPNEMIFAILENIKMIEMMF